MVLLSSVSALSEFSLSHTATDWLNLRCFVFFSWFCFKRGVATTTIRVVLLAVSRVPSPPPSPGLSPDNCQTTISTFSPQIKLEMSSAQGYGTITSQPSMSWKVAIFQHIISHSIYWREMESLAANSSSQLSAVHSLVLAWTFQFKWLGINSSDSSQFIWDIQLEIGAEENCCIGFYYQLTLSLWHQFETEIYTNFQDLGSLCVS